MPSRTGTAVWALGRRFLLIATFAMGMSIVFGGFAMYFAASVEESQMLDARLEQLGGTVLSIAESGLNDNALNGLSQSSRLKTRPTSALLYRYQVWATGGGLLMRSHEAPDDRPMVPLTQFGFGKARIGGEDFRTFSLPSTDGGIVVQVAECIDEKVGQVATTTAYYVGFLVLPFGVLFGATWLLLRRSMRAVESVAEQLTQRNPLDVTHLQVDHPPEEMLPIIRSLDSMFARVGRALSVERRFTSMAAHELKTPLAGLRAQAQLALDAGSREESREALGQVIQCVDRAAHMLDQLLALARIEDLRSVGAVKLQQVVFDDVLQDVLLDVAPLARAKNIAISAQFDEPRVEGLAFGLHLVLRNLIVNAVLYCPAGSHVNVSSYSGGGRTVLQVDDSGHGIPMHDRLRAFERFKRLGESQTMGVGLGLSIVLMVAELHGARIELLDSPLGGLRARLTFVQAAVGAAVEPQQIAATQ